MNWSGYPVLRDIKEVLMWSWLAQNTPDSPEVAAELAKRLRAVRTNASRKDWKPF